MRMSARTAKAYSSPRAGADSRMARQLPVECVGILSAPTNTMKRYEKFADQIAELIRSGMLAPGEKVPSVRHASRTYGVSPSTVFQAYYLLEDRGLRLGLSQPRPVSPAAPGPLHGAQPARYAAAGGDRRHDRGQPQPAPADRPALYGQRREAATGGTGDHQRGHGGAQSVPAMCDPAWRSGGHRGTRLLRPPASTGALKAQGGGNPGQPA